MQTLHTKVLTCHPATPCTIPLTIQVGAQRDLSYGTLKLHYQLCGNLDALLRPAPQPPGFADGLWQHTCLEAFISMPGTLAYTEFNFSPSGQWAAYSFSDYRQRQMEDHPPCPHFQYDFEATPGWLIANIAHLDFPAPSRLKIGLTAVIETIDGEKSYWALQHTAPQPDFHQQADWILAI